MKFDPDGPHVAISICGTSLACPQPFAAGQILSHQAAAVLNQTLAQSLKKGFTKIFPHELADQPDSGLALQEAFQQYVEAFHFGVRGARTAKAGPTEHLAIQDAKRTIAQEVGLPVAELPYRSLAEAARRLVAGWKEPQLPTESADETLPARTDLS